MTRLFGRHEVALGLLIAFGFLGWSIGLGSAKVAFLALSLGYIGSGVIDE